jgi:hypothetical protein
VGNKNRCDWYAGAAAVVAIGLLTQTPAMAADDGSPKPSENRVIASTNTAARAETGLRSFVALDEPRRLSDLAGNDERAWASARSVHARLVQRKTPR